VLCNHLLVLVGCSFVFICINYMSAQVFSFTYFYHKNLLIFNMNGVMCYFPQSSTLQGNHHVKKNNIDINIVEPRARMPQLVSSIQKYSYCNLVLYVAEGCHRNSSYVDATNICSSIPFHLATWTMFHDVKSTHYKKLLLP